MTKPVENVLVGLAGWSLIGAGVVWLLGSPPPGYEKDGWLRFQSHWVAGATHPDYPHIRSADEEHVWQSDPGYRFLRKKEGALDVHWVSGVTRADDAMRSDIVEGRWVATPGYQFLDGSTQGNGSTIPQWKAGMTHPACPKIFTSNTPRRWHAIQGYQFTSDPKSMAVVAMTAGEPMPTPEQRLIAGGTAAAAHYFSRSSPDDGFIVSALKAAVESLRDAAARQALKGAFDTSTQAAPQIIPCDFWKGIPAAQ